MEEPLLDLRAFVTKRTRSRGASTNGYRVHPTESYYRSLPNTSTSKVMMWCEVLETSSCRDLARARRVSHSHLLALRDKLCIKCVMTERLNAGLLVFAPRGVLEADHPIPFQRSEASKAVGASYNCAPYRRRLLPPRSSHLPCSRPPAFPSCQPSFFTTGLHTPRPSLLLGLAGIKLSVLNFLSCRLAVVTVFVKVEALDH